MDDPALRPIPRARRGLGYVCTNRFLPGTRGLPNSSIAGGKSKNRPTGNEGIRFEDELVSHAQHLMAGPAHLRRVRKRSVVRLLYLSLSGEPAVTVLKRLAPEQKPFPEPDIAFLLPDCIERFPEDVSEAQPLDPIFATAKDSLEMNGKGWVR